MEWRKEERISFSSPSREAKRREEKRFKERRYRMGKGREGIVLLLLAAFFSFRSLFVSFSSLLFSSDGGGFSEFSKSIHPLLSLSSPLGKNRLVWSRMVMVWYGIVILL